MAGKRRAGAGWASVSCWASDRQRIDASGTLGPEGHEAAECGGKEACKRSGAEGGDGDQRRRRGLVGVSGERLADELEDVAILEPETGDDRE